MRNDQELMIITTEGIIIRINVSDISVLGRITSGVKLINLDIDKDTTVASIAKVKEKPNKMEADGSEVEVQE